MEFWVYCVLFRKFNSACCHAVRWLAVNRRCCFLLITSSPCSLCVSVLISVHHSVSARVESPGWHGIAQSVHRGVEKVLHTVWHPPQTFLSAGDHTDGQTGKQQEVQCGGQHCSQGEDGACLTSTVNDEYVLIPCLRPQLMLDTWNESIFSNIKNRLQDSAMKLVHAERLGEAFDSQLVIGVRESYGENQSNTAQLTLQTVRW